MENTYLPRVWTEEGYYYPVFSEFGIIYENKNLPFDEEHIKDLDWAFQFHFTGDDIDFVYILERPTGLRDKNNKLIYQGDIVKTEWFGEKTIYQVVWDEKMACFCFDGKDIFYLFDDLPADVTEIIGNIHENPELLE